MKILVIGGGISDEREVAVRSSKAVHETAAKAGHDSTYYDWDGSWEWLNANVGSFGAVLPILHGEGGEDGVIQKFLESKNAAFLGTGSAASEVCFDKEKTRAILKQHDILVPEGAVVDFIQYKAHRLSKVPHVLKPNDGGSTIDALINITSQSVDHAQLETLFARYGQMLIEEYIDGIEATMPVLEGKKLPIIEIIPPEGQTFDYENKYNGKTQELCPPKNIDSNLQKDLQKLSKQVHDILDCRHLSRVDVIISGGKNYILETNTMPGMTEASLFPLAAKVAGMSMTELVDYLILLTTNSR